MLRPVHASAAPPIPRHVVLPSEARNFKRPRRRQVSIEVMLWLLIHPLRRPLTEQIVKLLHLLRPWQAVTRGRRLLGPPSHGLRLICGRSTTTCPPRLMGTGKFGTTLSAGSLDDHNFLVRLWLAASSYVSPDASLSWCWRARFC